MSVLSAFLHPIPANEEKEVMISNRFVEDGKPMPFKIRAITGEENAACRKAATRRIRDRSGNWQETTDLDDYTNRVIVAATVSPDFHDAALCEAYGTKDPVAVPGKMLLLGEYAALYREINQISGLDDSAEDEAKN